MFSSPQSLHRHHGCDEDDDEGEDAYRECSPLQSLHCDRDELYELKKAKPSSDDLF